MYLNLKHLGIDVVELVLIPGSGTHYTQENSLCISAHIVAHSMDIGENEKGGQCT